MSVMLPYLRLDDQALYDKLSQDSAKTFYVRIVDPMTTLAVLLGSDLASTVFTSACNQEPAVLKKMIYEFLREVGIPIGTTVILTHSVNVDEIKRTLQKIQDKLFYQCSSVFGTLCSIDFHEIALIDVFVPGEILPMLERTEQLEEFIAQPEVDFYSYVTSEGAMAIRAPALIPMTLFEAGPKIMALRDERNSMYYRIEIYGDDYRYAMANPIIDEAAKAAGTMLYPDLVSEKEYRTLNMLIGRT